MTRKITVYVRELDDRKLRSFATDLISGTLDRRPGKLARKYSLDDFEIVRQDNGCLTIEDGVVTLRRKPLCG